MSEADKTIEAFNSIHEQLNAMNSMLTNALNERDATKGGLQVQVKALKQDLKREQERSTRIAANLQRISYRHHKLIVGLRRIASPNEPASTADRYAKVLLEADAAIEHNDDAGKTS